MISLLARAIEVDFWIKIGSPRPKADFLERICSIWHEIIQKAFLNNDQLAGMSSIKNLLDREIFWIKRFFNQPDGSISPSYRKLQTSFRLRATNALGCFSRCRDHLPGGGWNIESMIFVRVFNVFGLRLNSCWLSFFAKTWFYQCFLMLSDVSEPHCRGGGEI